MTPISHDRLSRREALKWMLTAMATTALLDVSRLGADEESLAPLPSGGYGLDPDLTKVYNPGDLWPLTMTPKERRAATALCETIIPADGQSPSAADVGVPQFIDEWISAPYPAQVTDRALVIEGLAWLDAEAQRRFTADYADLVHLQKVQICDGICYIPKAKPDYKRAAQFFRRFRDLTAGGFYTTPQGTKDLEYIGNVPLVSFEGPPLALIQKLGLA